MAGGVVHITGAAGVGASTLGRYLSRLLGRVHLDTDDFYWAPTDPPYQVKYAPDHRVARLREAIRAAGPCGCVLSGSLDGWGDALIGTFDVVVFLRVPTAIRLVRLRQRELQRHGADALAPGGAMYDRHRSFMTWAAAYEAETMPGRSLLRHEAWLLELSCPIVRLDGTLPVPVLAEAVCCTLGGSPLGGSPLKVSLTTPRDPARQIGGAGRDAVRKSA